MGDNIRKAEKEKQDAAVFKQEEDEKKKQAQVFEADVEKDKPKQRRTITGMEQNEVNQLLLQLTAASHEYDFKVMEKLLKTCTKNGLKKEDLAEARKLLAD